MVRNNTEQPISTNPSIDLQDRALEHEPLLGRDIQEYYAQLLHDDNEEFEISSKIGDDRESIYAPSIRFIKRRFWWFFSLGIMALIVLQLSFLPRTSLSRDFRRWHGLHMTKSDVKRNYLLLSGVGKTHIPLAPEERVNMWLSNFTDINAKRPFSMFSSDNEELTSYVKGSFQHLGFKTIIQSEDIDHVSTPNLMSVKLFDTKSDKVLYNPNLFELEYKTPAFYNLGYNGTIKTNYVYANEGSHDDYMLLLSQDIPIKNRIVIVKSNLDSSLSLAEKIELAESFGIAGLISYNSFPAKNNAENENFISSAFVRDLAVSSHLNNYTRCSIPSIPMSFKAVLPILESMNKGEEPSAFDKWDYYPESPSTLSLEIVTLFEDTPRKLKNIVGSLKGVLKDGQIIIGARRDSYTSSNMLSGHSILLEIMSNLQKLRMMGWKPLRNIHFVSWDGSSSGLLGSKLFAEIEENFNQPILGYINIDGDAVTGSKLNIDSNPLFNCLLKDIAKYVPFPKKAINFKSLPKKEEENYDDNWSTLYHYWSKQNNNYIENSLGKQLITSDSLIFQNHLHTPIMNIKFENDPKRDPSIYLPNSNFYSYNWLIKRQIDSSLILHTLLIRYLGLLVISLSEHEVANYCISEYSDRIDLFYGDFLKRNEKQLHDWSDKLVPENLISGTPLLNDIKKNSEEIMGNSEKVNFKSLVNEFNNLIAQLREASNIYDVYSRQVQDTLIEDYPWYMYYKKIQVFAQFKVANFKLLRLERELALSLDDYEYLTTDPKYFDHIIYGIPKFHLDDTNNEAQDRNDGSSFQFLNDAVMDDDYLKTIKMLVITYNKLQNFYKKIM